MPSRRAIIRGLAGVTSAAGFAGCTRLLTRRDTVELNLPSNPHADALPARQHAVDDALRTDEHGNSLAPRYHTVLLLGLRNPPTVEHARTVERAMRELEGAYDWSPDGLFHVLAWGSGYFERIGELAAAPVDHPEVLSRTDDPKLETYDAALVLSADDPSTLLDAERGLFHGGSLAGSTPDARLGDVFRVVGRRTGFMGEGLPAAHTDADGIPDDAPLPKDAPMFMGFKSGRRGTQATEDRVTIEEGPFAGGTTMHLSRLRQSLETWFSLSRNERVARMFSGTLTGEDVDALTDDVPFEGGVPEAAREHDVVGHHEKVARVREDGDPLLLRRDFNTVDGGHAGVHFLSYQRSLADFQATRKAMNGWYLRDDSERVRERRNNGILDFITVTARANFYVPPRGGRSFPLL
ncbi:DUF7405 family protein [Halomarina litorea]|uniref:DUF7405 family protein n=1 Tax=Halomarina litorea TaxID=2961595 RepID=UPI0020C2A660|nr:Dyp-type peroxidase domain-containing protein [Halomarina sp. BCD28]